MPIATPEVYAAMLDRAKAGKFAYPAINVSSSQTVIAAIRGFAEAGSDGIIQFSWGGAEYASGSTVKDQVAGAVALAPPAPPLSTPALEPPNPASASAPWRQRMRQQRTWQLGLVGLGSLLAVAAVSAWTQWQGRAPTPLPRPVATEVSATPEISPEQLQTVLRRAGLDQSVRVEKADGQRHALWGVVQDQDQLEALLRDVMALTRKVIPHVLVQSEFEAQAQALQSELPPGIQMSTGQGGQVWLTGAPEASPTMQQTMALVRSELPEAVQVRVGSAPRTPAAAPTLQLAGLPPIVAVQSGQQAYVLLADGRRILPGGQMNAWRVVGIEGQATVLEDATGQSRRLER